MSEVKPYTVEEARERARDLATLAARIVAHDLSDETTDAYLIQMRRDGQTYRAYAEQAPRIAELEVSADVMRRVRTFFDVATDEEALLAAKKNGDDLYEAEQANAALAAQLATARAIAHGMSQVKPCTTRGCHTAAQHFELLESLLAAIDAKETT